MPTPKLPGQPDMPDPAMLGSIRHILEKAHLWGGNGHEALFSKIKTVLMAKHPEVIARAFGGDPNKAAAWIKDGWATIHGITYQCSNGSRSAQCWRSGGSASTKLSEEDMIMDPAIMLSQEQVDTLIGEDGITHELYFASPSTPVEASADGLIWKDVLMTGTWRVHPNASKTKQGIALTITEADLAEVVTAFNDNAWEHVTVPKTHKDAVDENTGFVKQIMMKDHPGKAGVKILRAGINFTDAAIKQKVLDGSIANVSCGLDFGGTTRTTDGKKFAKVIKHLALTNAPFIKGLKPFGTADQIAASEDNAEWEGSLVLDDTVILEPPTTETPPEGTELRQEENVVKTLIEKFKSLISRGNPTLEETNTLQEELDGLTIPEGLTAEELKQHLAELASLLDEGDPEESHGDSSSENDVAPVEQPNNNNEGGDITMPGKEKEVVEPKIEEAKPTEPAVITLSQDELDQRINDRVEKDNAATRLELSALRKENRERKVEKTLSDLADKGFVPAILTVVEDILLAEEAEDDLITLSEDDNEIKLSASDIVLRVLDAFPSETLLKFSNESKAKFTSPSAKEDMNAMVDAELESLEN